VCKSYSVRKQMYHISGRLGTGPGWGEEGGADARREDALKKELKIRSNSFPLTSQRGPQSVRGSDTGKPSFRMGKKKICVRQEERFGKGVGNHHALGSAGREDRK